MKTNQNKSIEEMKKEIIQWMYYGIPKGKTVPDFEEMLENITAKAKEEVDENTSDGYHTFKELYEYRKLYNALVFNEWASQSKFDVHKSKRHSDGELCFGGGWFIVVAELPAGQISNHYELRDWDLFKCEEKELPNQYDGHTPQDVAERILKAINN